MEIQYRIKQNNIGCLKSIYIGGGTPSLLTSIQLETLFSVIKKSSALKDDCEITIEVNPDDITEQLLESYWHIGINRLSCGIQSMNDDALKFAGRRASRKINLKALEMLKGWMGKLSLDLISGLPEETTESFIEAVSILTEIKPEHISMYELTLEEETPFGKMFLQDEKPYDFEQSDNLWLEAKQLLKNKGYYQYEVSNFAKTGFECRHNLTYWNHEDYLGCGSGGTGTLYNADGTGFRWTNSTDINEYIDFWLNSEIDDKLEDIPQTVEVIEKDDSLFEFFMMGLRKVEGVRKSDFKRIFKKDIPEKIMAEFKKWEEKGLCSIVQKGDDVIYSLGENGLLFLNQFLENII